MKTYCPKCQTLNNVKASDLLESEGLTRCSTCDTLFDALDGVGEPPSDRAPDSHPGERARDKGAASPHEPSPQPPTFDGDLPPLQASPEAALDVLDTLYEKKSRFGTLYVLLAVVLVVALAMQLAWQNRELLLRQFPPLEPLCEFIECRPSLVHAPNKFIIVYRDIQPTENVANSLTLNARIRNDADTAQPLPDIQLSLMNTNGMVLVRRRLTPREYLYPPPPKDRVIDAGEVITISLDFEDPGYQATGFAIDFL